jgi:hydroxymethylbilane synthase
VRIRLGTRGSRLALVQTGLVADRLRAAGHEVELVPIVTEGDVRPIDMVPGEGVFVAAIARALRAGEVDAAVHSAKDIPLEPEPGLAIAAYPERADARDALVTRAGHATLESLPPGTVVGTDSPRRSGFVQAARDGLRVVPLHGNVDTRLRRLDQGEVEVLVLAAAGVDRLGQGSRIDQRLDPRVVPPAPAQGALAVQARSDDKELMAALGELDDADVRFAVETERAVLEASGGGCRAPLGALVAPDAEGFQLLAYAVLADGRVRGTYGSGPAAEIRSKARQIGEWLADGFVTR